jgi:cystathionine gamma-synthase
MEDQTKVIHLGEIKNSFGAVINPIVQSTTFERGDDGNFVDGRDIYTRASNPNRRALEELLAGLENGTKAFAFSSGLTATMSIFNALGSDSHIILPDDIYYGSRVLIDEVFGHWGLKYTAVDMTQISEIEKAIQTNTKLIWIESPSNPSLKVVDIKAICSLAKSRNILSANDNTWATPYFTKSFDLGVDMVMHSSTKYFSGHSDILGGCVIVNQNTNSEIVNRIALFQSLGGGVPSPADCWLLKRSLATFYARMPIHGANAMELAIYLENHPKILKVNYPGLETNEYHELAKSQMINGFGGMLSFIIDGNEQETLKALSKLKLVKHATSLGGVETLVDHRKTAEGIHSFSPANLVRVSVGIESIKDIIEDFQQAFMQ